MRIPERIYNNGFAELRMCGDLENFFDTQKALRTNYYTVVWMVQGGAQLLVDDVKLGLHPKQMAFITPSKYIQLGEYHGEAVVVQFNREFYCIRDHDHEVSCEGILYFGAPGLPLIRVEPPYIESFRQLHTMLQAEFQVMDSVQEEMLRTLLKKWLIQSTRLVKEQDRFMGQDERSSELLRQFRILLEKHFLEEHGVSYYAKRLYRSPKTIANQFKLLGQESPRIMIQKRILAEGKRYLLYSELSVKEMSFKLGFGSPNAFSHFFKKIVGISPTQFRKAYQVNR
ncbi:MAG TPA: AraC family transcriptional regulator [Cytophagales bacterium]|nr:AraC family transcriptional regulator [Cytophagales bacterium]HAA19994.1 AraC family transcriptional regulator [Cytophagales bacterium]HAP63645.1 AraC family transcriptional regulator [Cytophagales bacterium]